MTTGCVVLARDDPEASWVARGERPWIKHTVDHPHRESEELHASQIPGASHAPHRGGPRQQDGWRQLSANHSPASHSIMWTTDAYSALPDARRHTWRLSLCVCVCVCTRARVGWRAGVQMKERMNHRQTQTGEPPNDPNSFIQQTLPEYLQCINPQDRRGRPADHPAATGAWLSPHPQPLAEAAPTLGQCRTTSPPSFTSVPAVAHGRCLIRAYQNRSPSPSPCRKQVVV